MKPEFKEEQRFSQWWLWLILIGAGFPTLRPLFKLLVSSEGVTDEFNRSPGAIISALIFLSIVVLFYFMRLNTLINQEGIQVKFFPFVTRKVNWNEVKTARVIKYGFVGGWGIRIGTAYGTVYSTKGNMGLAVELTSGKKLLVGTQRAQELEASLSKIRPKEFVEKR